MQLDMVSSTICPWCLIGKRRFEKALGQRPDFDLTIT
jgi:predicted DsbA family dithiol-disulfide isomerase